MKLLIDTNVWIDFFLPARNDHINAQELIGYCEKFNVEMYAAFHSITNFNYIFKNNLKLLYKNKLSSEEINKLAWNATNNIIHSATIVGADYGDAYGAFIYKDIHNDYEDDIVYILAQKAKTDYIVTNDKNMIKHSPIGAYNTKDALKLVIATYERN